MHASERSFHASYYTRTAHLYNQMHVGGGDEHAIALRYVGALLESAGLTSILDVGTETGRAIAYFARRHSGFQAIGTEPIVALLSQAAESNQIPSSRLVCGSGYELPFPDKSFDAACEFGMLHHVEDPNRVINEMMRVARSAIFLSDSNRFGQGPPWARVLKLALARAGLWGAANYLKNGGRAYTITDGDGLAYSYSVFDSFDRLATWADRVICVPTMTAQPTSWFHPLLTSAHILVCAIRD